jgi:hypothetical protein
MEEQKKPWYSTWGFLCPIVFVVFIAYWCWRSPNHLLAPGYAVTILGVAAVVMTVRADHFTKIEKMMWILVAIACCVVEINAIRHDREVAAKELADARAKEEDNFRKIGEGITNAIRESDNNFAQTMSRSDRIITGVGDSLKAQTGGDSFAFVTLTGPHAANFTFNKIAHPDAPWMLVWITSHGKYPLRDVNVVLNDDERKIAALAVYNKHPDGDFGRVAEFGFTRYHYPYLRAVSPEVPNGDAETLGAYDIPHESRKKLWINFSSYNGSWNEVLHLGLIDGQWRQCLSLTGPTRKQFFTPFIWCDTDWPEGKALAEKDWVNGAPASQ